MDTVVAGPFTGIAATCVPILRSLPEWFGIEEAILEYEQEVEILPTFLARAGGQVIGFLSLKQHYDHAAEIFVMAVRREAHRCGAGRALVEATEAHARRLGVEYMQVKTLSPSRPSEEYAGTRSFYQALGYRPLEEFPTLWGEQNPCLLLVKRI